jgi:NAD(P)-dependent dehydrogenase (short-subunit alcohol dehydrogenase family)
MSCIRYYGSYPSDRIKRLYDINVHGAFFTAREAAKHMIPQGGGSIILVASMSANVCLVIFFCSLSATLSLCL